MIIACPACNTRYVVPDSAIGIDGRTVRCAKCRHSWFQDGSQDLELVADVVVPVVTVPAVAAEEPASVTPPPPPPPIENVVVPPRAPVRESSPAPSVSIARGVVEPAAKPTSYVDAAVPDDAPSAFAHEPPFRPRRNPAKRLTALAAVFAVFAAGIGGALYLYGPPSLFAGYAPTFGEYETDLRIEFPPEEQERRTLPNGTEFFAAKGVVVNEGTETRRIPPMLIVLRDASDRIVYNWEVDPPAANIGPGERIVFNEAVTDVPRAARSAEIGWKPGS